MAKSSSPPAGGSSSANHRMPDIRRTVNRALRPVRAMAMLGIFFLKVFPMLPSRPIDWITPQPVIEKVQYPTRWGPVEGDLYRPAASGPHPGIVVCLGVVPFGVDHPQVPVLGKALARAGFVALLYWSPAMREFRLDPEDVEDIALAYQWLIQRPDVDPARSGLLGTCVGGSFALMAAASPSICRKVAFIAAYAPYSSMATFARDIASGTRSNNGSRMPWQVDPLTQQVFVHSLSAWLDPVEAERVRTVFAAERGSLQGYRLSPEGEAIVALLTAGNAEAVEIAMQRLPAAMQARLSALSPMTYLADIQAPLIVLLHDRGDQLIPIGESLQLRAALEGRGGVYFTEMQFQHLDPVKGKLPPRKLVRELGKFILAVYPMFRQAAS